MSGPDLSVIVPCHNPDIGRFIRTLRGLREQTLEPARWEAIVVDSASDRFPADSLFREMRLPGLRLVREPAPGLTAARVRGFREAQGQVCVMVDDDNVLAPDYLAFGLAAFQGDPRLGAAGGKSLPEFHPDPPAWIREFDGLLALRDLGERPVRAEWADGSPRDYPGCAPVGAGLAVRRDAALAYGDAVDRDPLRRGLDRTGAS
ncbi:MAG: glycosyltransferase, partial [Opitutaceae bacterium]